MVEISKSKKFYWIKLKDDFFEQDKIDWLQEQKNGCEYIVLYLKLCLMSANNNGRLIRNIGEIMIPYDEKKIAEKTGFSVDTVVVAFGLFRKLGLVFYNSDGSLVLPAVPDLVGSETDAAERQRRSRARRKEKMLELESSGNKNSSDSVTLSQQYCDTNYGNSDSVTLSHTSSQNCHLQSHNNVTKTGINGLTCDNVTDNVTTNVTLEIEKDKSLISSLSSLREGDAVKNEIVNLYRTSCSPMMAEIELERLLDCIDHYGPVWTKEAIETAAGKGKRNIAYIEGILKNWEVEGHEKCSNSKRKKTIQRKTRKATDGTETDWDAEAGKGWDD